jgi:hypothetical protein
VLRIDAVRLDALRDRRPDGRCHRWSIPGGAESACLIGDGCDDDGTAASDVVCAPLPAAMASFDERVRVLFPGGRVPAADFTGPLFDLVQEVVDRCGYQVAVDVAGQYPGSLHSALRQAAVAALGEIGSLPAGLRCAELEDLGLGPEQAVDYWFWQGAPALMDADADGVPCETVWPDVARYLPAYR